MESKNYRLNESKMFADITDGIAIIINAATGIYYGMNGYGTGIFDNLLAGSSTDDILAAIQEIPGAPANAEESLSACLETMLGFEIVDEKDKVIDMQVLARQKWAEARRANHNNKK